MSLPIKKNRFSFRFFFFLKKMNEKGVAEVYFHISMHSNSSFKAEIASVRFQHRDRGIQRNYGRVRERKKRGEESRKQIGGSIGAIARYYSSFETHYSKFAR